MKLTLGINIPALAAARALNQASDHLADTRERLSSGLRINQAGDDAAGLAVADTLNATRRIYAQGVRNLNDGISVLTISEGAVDELTSITIRIRELAEQAANGVYGKKQRQALDTESRELSLEYTRIIRTTEFNGTGLLDGSLQQISLQAGSGDSGTLILDIGGTKGTGVFGAGAATPAEAVFTFDAQIADLDGDGNMDMVTAGGGAGAGRVTVHIGNGDGTFTTIASYTTESNGSYTVALGDINNDGVIDIVSAGIGTDGGETGRATILIGAGDGTYSATESFRTESTYSLGVQLGDLNSDGNLDLVTVGQHAGGLATTDIRLGNGNGTFGVAVSYSYPLFNYQDVVLADINRDGKLDVILAANSSENGYTDVRLGIGNGNLGATQLYPANSGGTSSIGSGDLNGDGILDLVTAGYGGGITIRRGRGDGTFEAFSVATAGDAYLEDIQVGDLNGDGIQDLVVTSMYASGTTFTLVGNGDGSFGEAVSYPAGSTDPKAVTTGDLNNDGVPDLVTAGYGGGGRFSVQLAETGAGMQPLLSFALTTVADARQAMSLMDHKISQLAMQRSVIGAAQSRIETAIRTVSSQMENLAAAESRIREADIAAEGGELVRQQILQQSAAAIMAQANLQPQLILRLLQ